jgi:hypothetical protein
MAEQQHDDWLSALGIDVGQLRQTGGANPTIDANTAKKFGKGFGKGATEEAQSFFNTVDPTAQFAGNLLKQGIDAARSGDPSKIDLGKAAPDTPLTRAAGGFGAAWDAASNPNAPANREKEDQAVAAAKGLVNDFLDPVGATERGIDKLRGEDPEQVGEQVGRVTTRAGITVALAGAGVAELPGAVAGDVAPAGAVGDVAPAGAVGDASPGGAAVDAGGANVSPAAQTGAPPGEPPPVFNPDPAAASSAGDDPKLGFGDFGDQGAITPRVPSAAPEAPAAPASEPSPPSLPRDTEPNPPFDNPPPSALPGIDDPAPPPSLPPPGGPPGFPFGVDDAPGAASAPPPGAPAPAGTLDPAPADPVPARTAPPVEPAPDTTPDSALPETQDAPTLRDPPIPNPKQPFPDPDIQIKPSDPEPEVTPDTERTGPPPAEPVGPAPEPAPEPAPDTERTPEPSDAS